MRLAHRIDLQMVQLVQLVQMVQMAFDPGRVRTSADVGVGRAVLSSCLELPAART